MSRTPTHRAHERFTTLGADDPDRLIGVPAGELLEWGWLIGALADRLATAPDSAAPDSAAPDGIGTGPVATAFTQHLAGHPTREATAWMLEHIAERIGGLLDGDRGQP